MAHKDALRAFALNNQNRRSTLVTVEVPDSEPMVFMMLAPTIAGRDQVLQRGNVVAATQKNQQIRLAAMQVAAVIACAHEPQTEDDLRQGIPPVRVFDDGDFEALMNSPAGGIVDTLAPAAMALINGGEDKAEAKKD